MDDLTWSANGEVQDQECDFSDSDEAALGAISALQGVDSSRTMHSNEISETDHVVLIADGTEPLESALNMSVTRL